jgi:hypothetical protein
MQVHHGSFGVPTPVSAGEVIAPASASLIQSIRRLSASSTDPSLLTASLMPLYRQDHALIPFSQEAYFTQGWLQWAQSNLTYLWPDILSFKKCPLDR